MVTFNEITILCPAPHITRLDLDGHSGCHHTLGGPLSWRSSVVNYWLLGVGIWSAVLEECRLCLLQLSFNVIGGCKLCWIWSVLFWKVETLTSRSEALMLMVVAGYAGIDQCCTEILQILPDPESDPDPGSPYPEWILNKASLIKFTISQPKRTIKMNF